MFRRFPLGTKANVEKWVFSAYKVLKLDIVLALFWQFCCCDIHRAVVSFVAVRGV